MMTAPYLVRAYPQFDPRTANLSFADDDRGLSRFSSAEGRITSSAIEAEPPSRSGGLWPGLFGTKVRRHRPPEDPRLESVSRNTPATTS